MLWNTSIVRENAFLKKSSWIISTKNHSFCHLAMKKSVLKRMKNNFPAVCEQCCVCVQRGNGGDWDVEPGWLRRWPSGIGNYWKISLLSVFFMRLMSHWFHFIKDQEVDKFGFPVTCRELKLFQWTTLFSTTSLWETTTNLNDNCEVSRSCPEFPCPYSPTHAASWFCS